jgi:hypothetical protein
LPGVGLKPRSYWSLPPEWLGLQVWATVPSISSLALRGFQYGKVHIHTKDQLETGNAERSQLGLEVRSPWDRYQVWEETSDGTDLSAEISSSLWPLATGLWPMRGLEALPGDT